MQECRSKLTCFTSCCSLPEAIGAARQRGASTGIAAVSDVIKAKVPCNVADAMLSKALARSLQEEKSRVYLFVLFNPPRLVVSQSLPWPMCLDRCKEA